ncbi:hypothetical protein [Salinadaptatus halalkaliphilus]|nr:hypothetical protein [Salinadaptatus halalkaliphilus]
METATQYEDFDPAEAVLLTVPEFSEDQAQLFAEQLSAFLESHDGRSLLRCVSLLYTAVEEDSEAQAVATTGDLDAVDDDLESNWSIELQIEGLSSEAAEKLARNFQPILDGTLNDPALLLLGGSLAFETEHQPRSVIRLPAPDGADRNDLEWHTDTTVSQKTFCEEYDEVST